MNYLLKTVGRTPFLKVEGIWIKLETTNPTGSIKDRMAWFMIQQAEKRDELKTGQTIIEVTSGNTGIALAAIAAAKGYHFIAVMPESMSLERRKMMQAFGAELILTPAKEDMAGAVKKYQKLIAQYPTAWLPQQFQNPDNVLAHEEGLGQEIIKHTNGQIDAFVAGVGTGGTLIGVARALKHINPKIKIIAVEPTESAVLSGQAAGFHRIQGIGEGFVPAILKENLSLIDEVITISSDEAEQTKKYLTERLGLMVGTSSGANFLAARKIRNRYKKIVTVFPDRGERYLS